MTEKRKALLLKLGWYETNDKITPFKKVLLTVKDDEDHPDKVHLILHNQYEAETYAIELPSGELLNLNIESVEDLQKVEQLVVSYNPIY